MEQVPNIKEAVSVSSGREHQMILLRTGQILTMGMNKTGQLGISTDEAFSHLPVNVKKSVQVVLNGTDIELAVPPIIRNGTSYVPIRGIFEEMGAKVAWDMKTRSVIVSKEDTKLILNTTTGETEINGSKVSTAAEPIFLNSSVLVPLRFISETLGANVKWDPMDYSVRISTDT